MTINGSKLVCGAAFITILSAGAAFAGSGKDYYVETYRSAKPMHGYSGTAGNYYCDYQRLPERSCKIDRNGNERCKITGWTLRQHCY